MKHRFNKSYLFCFSILLCILFTNHSQAQWVWQNPLPQGNYLTSTFQLNPSTIYVAGGFGTIFKTTNGGLNWTDKMDGVPKKDIYSIIFMDSLLGWVAGGEGLFIKTTNGGDNWNEINTGVSHYFATMAFTNYDTGWIGWIGKLVW